jgi:alkylation response protein AidB-like acyl-CoA dehydrogenase
MTTADASIRSPLDAARRLAPSIRQAAEQIEADRELPRPLFEALADAGLFQMLVPRSLGGQELDLPTYIKVMEELGKADASTAWAINQGGVFATHSTVVARDVARMVWVETPRSVVANIATPTIVATPVDGGYRVNGQGGFSTGSRHSAWLATRGKVLVDGNVRALPDGQEDVRFFLVPAAEAEIVDTWQVRGMRGTGTHDIRVTDLFVPEERSFLVSAPVRDERGPLYLVPRTLMFAIGDAATALGCARACMETFVDLASGKTPWHGMALLRDSPLAQIEIGHAEADLRSSRALLFETIRELWESISASGSITLSQRIDLRLATTHGIRAGARVVDRVYNIAGATAIYRSHPMQRYFQDAHVMTQHFQARLDHYQVVGQACLGVTPDSTHGL